MMQLETKKKMVIVMNCAGDAIRQYLLSSKNFTELYNITLITTYVAATDTQARGWAERLIGNADVVLSQDVQSIEWLRNDNIEHIIKKDCEFIRLAFWRFDGYWPIKLPRFNDSLWYLPDEFGKIEDFDVFISRGIGSYDINTNFASEIEEFFAIDSKSDVKMFDFFINNHLSYRLFSDHWHPTSYFFLQVARYIMQRLNVSPDIRPLPSLSINQDRYRLILNQVYKELNLQFEKSLLPAYGEYVTECTFFNFCIYAKSNLKFAQSPAQAALSFRQWAAELGLQRRLTNIACIGTAEQSSRSEWSCPDDPMGAILGPNGRSFSFHTGLEQRPWFLLDLKELRSIDTLIICNRSDGFENRALPLSVSISINRENWEDLALINYEFGSRSTDGRPLRLDFNSPLAVRYVKIVACKETWLHLQSVEAYCSILQPN